MFSGLMYTVYLTVHPVPQYMYIGTRLVKTQPKFEKPLSIRRQCVMCKVNQGQRSHAADKQACGQACGKHVVSAIFELHYLLLLVGNYTEVYL